MRVRPNVVAVAGTLLSVVLTSCGLAIGASTALAPDEVASRPAPATLQETIAQAPGPARAPAPAVAPEPVVVPKPTLTTADLYPALHIWQSLNNCGPAAVVMALSTFGIGASQETARLALRGENVLRGMGPAPVDPWVQKEFGLRSMSRNNGTNELMKKLISNGFAPMVTQWLEDPWLSRVAHWRAVLGHDDARGVFYVNDSMRGAKVPLSYSWFDENWMPFSYRYMVIYKPGDEKLLRAIVGEDWGDFRVRQRLYERARGEALSRNTSAAWLAYGEAAYQNGMFEEAVAAMEKGMLQGSAQGVFTLRSSYPRALRALGRNAEADAAQARLSSLSPVPATVAPAPDPYAVWLWTQRTVPFDALRVTD